MNEYGFFQVLLINILCFSSDRYLHDEDTRGTYLDDLLRDSANERILYYCIQAL